MRESELANRHPRNPGACVSYGRTCDFFGVCTGEESIKDERLFTRRESRAVHAELGPDDNAFALLTTSRLSAYRACPRLHKLRYIDGYRPAVEAESLRFGSLVHRGLQRWWEAWSDERLDAALAALRAPESVHDTSAPVGAA